MVGVEAGHMTCPITAWGGAPDFSLLGSTALWGREGEEMEGS